MDGLERDFERRLVRPLYLRDVVVVDGDEEASQKLAVEIGRDADGTDNEIGRLEEVRVVEHRVDERAVHDRNRDEQAGEAVRRQPALVAGAREPADRPRPARGTELGCQGPDGEHEQPNERHVAEGVAERRLVRIWCRCHERDVRHEEQYGGRRGPLVPDGDPVEAAEGPLDRREHGGEYEGAGQQEHGFGAA